MSEQNVSVEVSVQARNVQLAVSGNGRTMGVEIGRELPEYPVYHGEHTFTPSGETQTVPVANHTMLQDIVINPVPSNYGLITYNGNTITVS